MSFKLLLNILLICLLPMLSGNPIAEDGTFQGQRLCGKVKVVDHGKAFKVKIVEHYPNLNVKIVSHYANDIGEWQFVEHDEDFCIRFVESYPDFTIRYVEHYPGRN